MSKKFKGNPLAVIFLTIFVDMLGFGILIPVIPLLLADPQSPYYLLPDYYSIESGYILLGYLLAMFPLMQFIATPILGQLSDRFGRKNILAFSLAGTALSYVLFAYGIITRNIPLLFIARGFDGFTGGNVSVAQAAIADVTKPENRTKAFGMVGAAFGLGFILGPYIGGKLSDPSIVSWFDASTPFWFAAILSFINVLSVLFIFPETKTNLKKVISINWGKSFSNIAHAYTLKELRVIFLTIFIYNSGFTFFTSFFSVFLINNFHFTQSDIGDFFAYIGLWVAITQGVVTSFVSKHIKEFQVLRFSMIGTGVFLLCYFLPNVWWQLLIVTPFFAICNGLSFANSTSLVSKSANKQIQGEVLGINASILALAQVLPPILSGYIASKLSPDDPIFVSSIVIVLAGVIFLVLYKPKKLTPKEIKELTEGVLYKA